MTGSHLPTTFGVFCCSGFAYSFSQRKNVTEAAQNFKSDLFKKLGIPPANGSKSGIWEEFLVEKQVFLILSKS